MPREAHGDRRERDRGALEARLAALAADAVVEALDEIAAGRASWQPQPAALATLAPKLDAADAALDFARPAAELARRVRALAPRPGAAAQLGGERLRILAARAEPGTPDRAPGLVKRRGDELRVATGDGWLVLERLQRAGGKVLACAEFLRGFDVPEGARLDAPARRCAWRGRLSGRGARPRRSGLAARRRAAPTQARLLAARVLERVEKARAFADLALSAALGSTPLGARDRAFATELVYGTLRWRGRLDHLLGQVVDRPLDALEPVVRTLLRLGAYQILFCDGVPASAAVDQSVRSARVLGAERAAGLVNAVLRRLARARGCARASRARRRPARASRACALACRPGSRRAGSSSSGPLEAAALAEASNAAPPLTARVNPLRLTRDALLAELLPRFPKAQRCRFAAGGIVLGHGGAPGADPAFVAGLFSVQDEASQLVVELLDPQPGERVLDACAAPGAKASACAERVGPAGLVVALDKSERRLALVGRAARRLGLANVTALARDATQPLAELPGAPFDRVLVDAPCSGLGALRRNPDARWRVSPDDPAPLARTQPALLASAAAALRPGGALVYSTCTLLPEENEAVVAAFLSREPGFRRTDARRLPEALRPLLGEDGCLRTWPHRHGMDGFFAARLERTPA